MASAKRWPPKCARKPWRRIFALVLAAEGQRLANDSAALAAQAAQAAGKRVAAGKISPVEHSRALAAQALAQAQALQAAAAQRQASADLALWLGQEALPGDTQLSAAKAETLPRLPAWPPGGFRGRACGEKCPIATGAQSGRRRFDAQVCWPDVTLSLGVKRGAMRKRRASKFCWGCLSCLCLTGSKAPCKRRSCKSRPSASANAPAA